MRPYTRTHLVPAPDWQGPGCTGCWEVGYYLDGQHDSAIRLIQSLTPGPVWFGPFVISYLRFEGWTHLAAESRSLTEALLAGANPVVRRAEPDGADGTVDHVVVDGGRLSDLVRAAKRWRAGEGKS